MSFQRRASAFDLGRRMDARFMARAGGGPPPFSYDDIPNQLLRINSLEGSLAFSGAVLTGVTDVSPAGETVTVTGSPTYTATDSGLNNAPSFTIATASSVKALGVNLAQIQYFAAVFYRPSTAGLHVCDGNALGNRYYLVPWTDPQILVNQPGALSATGEPAIGRKRLIVAHDGVTPSLWNGASCGTIGANPNTGTGLSIGSRFNGTYIGLRTAFVMACSSVPSAPLLAALEAKLITDFG